MSGLFAQRKYSVRGLWQGFLARMSQPDSTHWVAVGFAVGAVMGLIPKSSLLVYLLGVLVILSPANLLAALVAMIAFSLIGAAIGTTLSALGTAVLTVDALQPVYRAALEWPLVGWTRFNHSVVFGATIVGLAIVIPVYWSARLIYHPIRAWLAASMESSRAAPSPLSPGKELPA